MQRREFLQKSGLSLPAVWFLGRQAFGIEPKPIPLCEQAKTVSTVVIDPETSDKTTDGKGKIWDCAASQTQFLKDSFSRHEQWLCSDKHPFNWKGPSTVAVDMSTRNTRINCAHWDWFVEPRALISIDQRDGIYIHHKAPSGCELNWYFRPLFHTVVTVMGIDQVLRPAVGSEVLQGMPSTGQDSLLYYRIEEDGFGVTTGHCEWDEIDDVMHRFKVQMCVIDQYPQVTAARRFARRYPDRVYLASHISESDAPKIWNWTTPIAPQRNGTYSLRKYTHDPVVPINVNRYRGFNEEDLGRPLGFSKHSSVKVYCQVARDILGEQAEKFDKPKRSGILVV
jgi:hypothetical protein